MSYTELVEFRPEEKHSSKGTVDIALPWKKDLSKKTSRHFDRGSIEELVGKRSQNELAYEGGEVKNHVKPSVFVSGSFKESWSNIINIKSKVVSFNKDMVHCECLVDEIDKCFETRVFPRIVFDSIHLKEDASVMITIMSKPGSIKIEVVDGSKMFDDSAFKMNDEWKDVERGFSPKKFTGFND